MNDDQAVVVQHDGSSPTRRQVLEGAVALTATVVAGCTGHLLGRDEGDAAPGDADQSDGVAPGDGGNRAPIWQTIPDQTWVVGVPVSLDLADYCTDPDGDALSFSLDLTLPAGLVLVGSVISGTPTAETASTQYMATADDGR